MCANKQTMTICWEGCACLLVPSETCSERRKLLFLCAELLPGAPTLCPQELSHRDNGQPYFPAAPALHLSLSACRGWIAAAVAQVPVAVDIESPTDYDTSFMRAVSTISEWETIRCAPDPCLAFCELWTKKEAVLKCSGIGIQNTMQLRTALQDSRCRTKTWSTPDVILTLAQLPL